MKSFFGIIVAVCFSVTGLAEKPKVGFVLSTLQEERYQRDRRVFTETAEKLGAEVFFVACNNNELVQTSQVDNLISRGVKVIVVQPVNGNAAANLVRSAKQEGVKVVDYDRLIPNSPIDAYITEDSFEVGRLQAEAVAQKLGGKGRVVLLMGQAGHSVAEARTKGVVETLKKYPGIKIILQQYHQGWSPALAMRTVEDVLTRQQNKVDAIIANNSGMAHGAIQALEEQKLAGKVFVAGADADLANIRNMVMGKQQFEVQISIEKMASTAAEVAVKLARGESVTGDRVLKSGSYSVPTFDTPVYGITRDTLEERVIKTGFHSREAVFGGLAQSR